MSVTESFLSRLSQKIKAFYLDQQGVYGVIYRRNHRYFA